MNDIRDRILELKKAEKRRDTWHLYQMPEIQDIADFVGDSLELAKLAQGTDRTSSCLRRLFHGGKREDTESGENRASSRAGRGCPMADMVTPEKVRAMRAKYPDAAVVCYVNSSAATKGRATFAAHRQTRCALSGP
jgi:quinolinate synthase